jgi:hypothetical protein
LTGSGTLTIPSGAQLNFSGSGNKILNGTLNIAGTFLTTATGPLMMNAGSSVTNSGLFSMQADNNVFLVSGSTGSLTNTGVLRKSAGTGTTTVNYPVVNSAGGTISVQTGILAIGAAGPPATGLTFNGASSLEITGGNTANTSLSLPNVVTQGPGAVLTIKVTDDGTLIKTGSQVYNWTVITGAGTNLTSLGLSAFAVAGGNVPITNASVSLLGSDVRITFTPVPEPAGLLLAAGAAWAVRRRRAV